jgi:HlyD family secretion protein
MHPVETKPDDLSTLRIDRSRKESLDTPRRFPWRILLYAGAGVVAIVAGAFLLSAVLANLPVVEVQRPTIEPGTASGSVVLTAGGYIVAKHPIKVSSKVIGKVAWVGVVMGDHVQEGQVLVRLEDQEYQAQLAQAQANLGVARARLKELETGSRPQEIEAARAAVEQAAANLRYAELNLRRMEKLFAESVASQQQLDNARMQYDVCQAQVQSAQKNFELVRIGPRVEQIEYARAQVAQAQAAVDYAQTQVDSTLIRAPVTGTVLERLVERGEMVTTMNLGGTSGVKASVVSLADLKDLQVELDINQNDFPKVSARQACLVTTDAYPDRVYRGVVDEIAPQANRQKATIQVKVKILEPDDYLRPDMNAKVSFLSANPAPSAAPRQALALPRTALLEQNGKWVVFILEGGRVRLREVRLGRDLGDKMEVAEGVGANDRVVVRGLEGLSTGQRVKVKQD